MVKILYFARLAETLGMRDETMELPEQCCTVQDLVDQLRARGEPFEAAFNGDEPVLVAINQEMSETGAEIGPGDEIAFFPPVTGG